MTSENPNVIYYEHLGIEHFLKHFKSIQVGMCRLVDHPVFGIDSYPATIFTNAPKDVIEREMDKIIQSFPNVNDKQ